MVPQAVAADRLHLRAVAEGVHLEHRREFRVVGEVVPVFALEVRGRRTLGRDEADFFPMEYVREEREGETSEVRSPAEAGDHQVRILADLLELPLGFESDDRLMQEDMVQDGAEAIDRLVIAAGVLESL